MALLENELTSARCQQQGELDALRAQVERAVALHESGLAGLRSTQHSELEEERTRMERSERLAEQANTDITLLRQQWLQQQQSTTNGSRKRKRPSSRAAAADDKVIGPASLFDHPFTAAESVQYVERCFDDWRKEEVDVTIGAACITAVLTLLNHRLQRANDRYVRFVPSYPGLDSQDEDDAVFERCMGLDFSAVQYVVAPVSVDDTHWALLVWDVAQRQMLLIDSVADALVQPKHATRLRGILKQDGRRAKKAVRVAVQSQQDVTSCGVFVLCFACYMATNGSTWRSSISSAVFSIDSMRSWLEHIQTPGEQLSITLNKLPTFLATPA